MELEQIVSELTKRAGNTGLNVRTINDYVSAFLPDPGTEPDEAYWTKHVGVLKSLGGNFSHDVAAQVNEFKKTYKPEPKPNEPAKVDDTNQALLDRLTAIENSLAGRDKQAKIESLKNGVAEKASELKVSNVALWKDAVSMVQVEDGATQESLLSAVKSLYESKLKLYVGDGAMPYGGGSKKAAPSVSDEEAKDRREAFKAKMRANGRLPQATQ